MIPEVLKELWVLLETLVEPGELDLGDLGVGCNSSGFRHGIEESAGSAESDARLARRCQVSEIRPGWQLALAGS
jgi:hypothetical protein